MSENHPGMEIQKRREQLGLSLGNVAEAAGMSVMALWDL